MARRRKRSTDENAPSPLSATDARRSILTYIQGVLASLNGIDQQIARYVLADPEKVVVSSITEIKQACGASAGSIVGFCRRLGLTGFAQFKIALARDLAHSGLPASDAQEEGSLVEKVFQSHARSLTETCRINPQATFERVARALANARRIEFFSIGLSYPVAYTASCKFLLLGLPAAAQFDSHIQLITATQLRRTDVAFGVSCSGATGETVQCLQVAKAQGATTICLTNAMKSPITLHSDLSLYATPSEIKYFQAPLASRMTQLAVIDALFVSLALKRKNATAARLQVSGEALLKRRLES